MVCYLQDLDDIDTYDSSVINCLQDYSTEIKSNECKGQVKKYVTLASQDIRFDVPLAEACYEDRQKYCASVPPVSASDHLCLFLLLVAFTVGHLHFRFVVTQLFTVYALSVL